MGIFSRKDTGPEKVGAEVEGEIRELVSRDVAEPRRQLVHDGGDVVAHNLNLLMQRVSMDSVQEIDQLISDLKLLRERLHHDSERMVHEIADYATLGPVATQSSKIISEYLNYWKRPLKRQPLANDRVAATPSDKVG